MNSRRPRIPNKSLPSNGPTAADGAPRSRKILTGWKEISNHINRGVRTLQRYESQFGLPIHRPAGKDRSAVIAFSDELHQWLSRSPVKNHRHVRRVLLVLDLPRQESISNRKLVLEVGKFNVLTALSAEELYETAEKFEVDAYVIDCPPGDSLAAEICESLKERHPNQPLFAVVAETGTGSDAAKCADYVVNGNDAQKLLAAVTEVFGPPRIE